MNILGLHHVGIVFTSMDIAHDFMDKFALKEDYCEYVDAYHAYCLFCQHGPGDSPIELVIPTEGVLTNYRDGKGGLHHIAFEVDDVEAARKEFDEKGLEMLETEAVKGAGGIRVNFVRPRHSNGVLVEFVEREK